MIKMNKFGKRSVFIMIKNNKLTNLTVAGMGMKVQESDHLCSIYIGDALFLS